MLYVYARARVYTCVCVCVCVCVDVLSGDGVALGFMTHELVTTQTNVWQ